MAAKPYRVLVIRHEPCSSLGLLGRVMQRDQIPFRYLDTPSGEVLTEPIDAYSHLVILGGAISAYEDDRYPFLRHEFKLIEQAIDRHLPTLGICLGSQILARVLGAPVYRGAAGREVGWCSVQLTEAGQRDRLFQSFPSPFQVFESHQDTFEIPQSCAHLAFSDLYPHQSFRYQDHVWAIQFHLEINDQVLSDCAEVIDQEILDSQIEGTSSAQLVAEAKQHTPAIEPLADSFTDQFLKMQSPALA